MTSNPGVVENDRAAWIANRRTGIGASEWAMVLGLSPFKSPYALACEKLGQVEPEDMSGNEDIEYGHAMEGVTLDFLAKRTGRVVRRWPQNESRRHSEIDFLFATPDAIQHTDDRGEGIAQAKNTSHFNAREWAESPPLMYQIQAQAEMFVMGYQWGTLCATIGGNRFRWYDIERNDRFIDAAMKVIEAFWHRIRNGEMPDVDGSRSTEAAIASLYPSDNGEVVHLGAEYERYFAELRAIKKAQKALDDRRRSIENVVTSAIGDNSMATLPSGGAFTWKQQTRKEILMPASTFRVLRMKEPKGLLADDAMAEATAALLAHGAALLEESDSGSRYFELAGGLIVRASDHEPNEATDRWMGRQQVASIRVDQGDWRSQLEAITGTKE